MRQKKYPKNRTAFKVSRTKKYKIIFLQFFARRQNKSY